jgi:hypothetical protein
VKLLTEAVRRRFRDFPRVLGARAVVPALLAAAAGLALLLGGCGKVEQWYGAALYLDHCARCHGSGGEGQDLRRPYGSIAPDQEGWIAPALNGRGHCFLHTRKQLFSIIRDGSPFPGTPMLGSKGELSDAQVEALIAYTVSLWDRNTREQYELREEEYRKLGQ